VRWLSLVVGIVLLTALFVDVFGTVFVPRGGAGCLTRRLYRVAWRAWKRIAAAVPPHCRRRVLALGGPLLLPLTVGLWVGELIVGFTLVYVPLVAGLTLPPGSGRDPTWITAMYYSGYCATTLGVGDVYATTPTLRLLAVAEAIVGFSLFSASISYLLNVYGTLTTTTSLARELARFAGLDRGADAVDTLVALHQAHAFDQLVGWLTQATSTIQRVVQGQAHYPVLHYFHIPDDESALPVTLPALLEILTIIRSVLDPAAQPALVTGPVVVAAYDSAAGVERGQARALRIVTAADPDRHRNQRPSQPGGPDARDIRARLLAAGIASRTEPEACHRYRQLRRDWSGPNAALRRHFGYP
jgi:Ion channel